MAVVVTGAAGFLGRALVDSLLSRGERVLGVDRVAQTPRAGLVVLTADLLDDDSMVHAALADADAVFHLAGRPGVRDACPDIATRRIHDNVLATAKVLACVPLRTPLVVTSSSSVYGGTTDGRACAEDDLQRPLGGYARSKAAAEQLCVDRLERGGVVALARPFTVIGEGQRPDMALARWIAAAGAGRPLEVLGSPWRTRDLTDVRDVVRALQDLAAAQVRGPVNVGTGVGHPLTAMAGAVAAALDVEVRLRIREAGSEEPADTLADTRRLEQLLGWVPNTDLGAAVALQVASVLDQQTASIRMPRQPTLPAAAARAGR